MNPPRYNIDDRVIDKKLRVGVVFKRRHILDGWVYSVGFDNNRVSLVLLLENELEPWELGWTKPGGTL